MAERKMAGAQPVELADQSQVVQVAFELGQELTLDMREDELVTTFNGKLRGLLRGRHICIRVVDPKSLQIRALIDDGLALRGIERVPLTMKRSAFRRTRLEEGLLGSGRVELQDPYRPILRGSVTGFSVPLVASRQLFGVVNIEYPEEQSESLREHDESVVILLANQLSVALHNLALLDETRYYRDYLHQVIDVANALIIAADRNGRITVINRTMRQFLGVTDELVGLELEDLRTRSSAPEPKLGTLLKSTLSDGHEFSDRELYLSHHDGTLVRAVFNTSVVRTPSGTIAGVIGIGQDRERVRALERQVIQAEKMATLGQLAAGVVHELNNPLTAISVYGAYFEQAFKLAGNQPDLEKSKKIVDAADRIQKLTRDLTNYTRPAGEVETVSMNEVVEQALSFCEHVIKQSRVVLEKELSGELPLIRAMRSQMHQVIINLVTNACHAANAPDQVVRVRTNLSPSGNDLYVEITDSGAGIHEKDRERVFEPFFTTKTDGKGTGLGLSIVRNIIEAHGGKISFESAPGAGTSFLVALPLTGK